MVQAVDVSTMSHYVSDLRAFGFRDPLQSRFWNVAAPHYRQLVLVPSNLCTHGGFVDYSAFSLLAGRHGLGINSGMTARYDVKQVAGVLQRAGGSEMRGRHARRADRSTSSEPICCRRGADDGEAGAARCTMVDGFGVCFSPESYARWRGEFDRRAIATAAADEFVRFYEELNDDVSDDAGPPGRARLRRQHEPRRGHRPLLAYRMEGCEHADAERGRCSTPPARRRRICVR